MDTTLTESIENEIKRRYEDLANEDVLAEYSFEKITAAVGNEDLIKGLLSSMRIVKCKCCGKPLLTTGRGRECYCNRLFDGKRTCKEVGPTLARRSDPITREMDRSRRLHLWRRSKAGKTPDACSRYSKWLSFALENEKRCRNGEITIDQLRDLIGAGYGEDKMQ